MNNNEINTSELTSAFLNELAELLEFYSHVEGPDLVKEIKEKAYNLALIEEADRIRENS